MVVDEKRRLNFLARPLAATKYDETSLPNAKKSRQKNLCTADHKYLAAAPLEDCFWANFCDAIELPAEMRDDRKDPRATRAAVAQIILRRNAAEWLARFEGKDVCCNVLRSVREAMADPQFAQRGTFQRSVVSDGAALPAVCVPVDLAFREPTTERGYPRLGVSNALLGSGEK